MQREVWAVFDGSGFFRAAYPVEMSESQPIKGKLTEQGFVIRAATLIIAGDILNPCPSPGKEWQCPLPAGHPGPCQD